MLHDHSDNPSFMQVSVIMPYFDNYALFVKNEIFIINELANDLGTDMLT